MINRQNIRLYLVDDDPMVLRSLCALISAHGLNPLAFSSAEAFLDHYDPREPGCLLLDIKMPGMDGVRLQARLNESGDDLPIIILTGHGDVAAAVLAMKRGAIDFIEKPVNVDTLMRAIDEAVSRLGDEPPKRIPDDEVARRLSLLTHREREVLEHLIQGKINKHIAVDLGISRRTVEIHRARVQTKMEANSLADLIRLMKPH
ncbi:MAG: response regulator [Alphaproteobacteria bacterium]|nr:response regulator [Alphaproteobacteria bacterium]